MPVKEIQSVRNACALLETVAAHQPVGVRELARLTSIDKSAVHRVAVTLQATGWLEQIPDGRWRVSADLTVLARRAGEESLVARLRPVLGELRDATAETVLLVAVEHDRLRVLDKAESPHALKISPSSNYLPLRNSSAARAVAPFLPADELEALRTADPSIDDATIEEVRARGWAINDREIVGDARVVGAPVRRADGIAIAAVIIVAPTSRAALDTMHAIGERLARTIAEE